MKLKMKIKKSLNKSEKSLNKVGKVLEKQEKSQYVMVMRRITIMTEKLQINIQKHEKQILVLNILILQAVIS